MQALSLSGTLLNFVAGFCAAKVPAHWFLGGGTLLSGVAHVLLAVRKQGASYWTYEFFGHMLSYGGPGLGTLRYRRLLHVPLSILIAGMFLSRQYGPHLVTKVVNPAEVAVGGACLQFWSISGGACGSAFSTLVYTNVGNLDVSQLGDTGDPPKKADLLRGLRATYWFWSVLCFFGKPKPSLLQYRHPSLIR